MALQGNKIVVVGFSCANPRTGDFALARYNPDGSLDPNFSGDGKRTTAFGSFGDAGAFGVALQSDGKIVAVGITNIHGSHTRDFALARYNLNGSLDTSFSGDGKQTADSSGISPGRAGWRSRRTARSSRSAGLLTPTGAFALARFNPNGSLDTSFSADGLQTTDFGVGAGGARVAIQGDDKIVAVGQNGDPRLRARPLQPRRDARPELLRRRLADDRLSSAAGDMANDVAIQANGRIVAVGFAGGGATGSDFALARYNSNGTLDTSFSGDGRRRTNIGGTDGANGVALQGDGRIVAVGKRQRGVRAGPLSGGLTKAPADGEAPVGGVS